MKFLTKLIGSSCVVPLAVLGVSAYERRLISADHYHIASSDLPIEFEGMKIVFLSDLHNATFGKENRGLIQVIDEEHPDFILVGGDMIIGKSNHTTDIAFPLLKRLSKKYQIICANGNHEFRMKIYKGIYGTQYDDYVTKLREQGIIYLENQTAVLRRGGARISISGLEIERKYYQRGKKTPMDVSYLNQTLGEKTPGDFRILLAHNPLYFPEYAKWGADLVLSGHNHGGLIRIPHFGGMVSPQTTFFPEYDAGHYEMGNSQMIISRGLGTHTFHIRVRNYPELSVIKLYKRNKK
ncbi:MAG: metallophosphoesterase [Lachnospiraceae bacterium]|nr:metallophosphoesterase [Lachnospiraceae bacterium]